MALNYSSNGYRQGKSKISTESEQIKKNEEKMEEERDFLKFIEENEENEEKLLSMRLFHELKISCVRVFIS